GDHLGRTVHRATVLEQPRDLQWRLHHRAAHERTVCQPGRRSRDPLRLCSTRVDAVRPSTTPGYARKLRETRSTGRTQSPTITARDPCPHAVRAGPDTAAHFARLPPRLRRCRRIWAGVVHHLCHDPVPGGRAHQVTSDGRAARAVRTPTAAVHDVPPTPGRPGLCELLPLLFMPFVGGALADSLDRRRLIIYGELAFTALTGVLLVNGLLGRQDLGGVYLVGGGFHG